MNEHTGHVPPFMMRSKESCSGMPRMVLEVPEEMEPSMESDFSDVMEPFEDAGRR